MPTLRSLRPLAMCLAACFVVTPTLAATIRATANDTGGKPVAGVVLTLHDSADRPVAQQTTDAQGAAIFANVVAGRYTVRSDSPQPVPVGGEFAV